MTSSPVLVDVRAGAGYAIVTMCKEPVNSLDHAMWSALESALDSLEADSRVRGVIFVSGLKKDVFSAGNDLSELYSPGTTKERYSAFWITQNRFLVKLLRSRLATVAAIRGACPAGGCIIALCCDSRVMTRVGNMGLNEVLLGIPVPKFWGLRMAQLIGSKAAESLLLNGRLVPSQEAFELGLVDELVDDSSALLPLAEKRMQTLARLPPHARAATKESLRGEFADAWRAFYPIEPEGAWKFLCEPATIKVLGATLQRLGSGKDRAAGANGPSSKL